MKVHIVIIPYVKLISGSLAACLLAPLSPLRLPSDISETLGRYKISESDLTSNMPCIFDNFAEMAYKEVEQPDGMQIPNDWGNLVESLPLLSEDYHYHLFGLRERTLIMILISVSRVLLCLLTT